MSRINVFDSRTIIGSESSAGSSNMKKTTQKIEGLFRIFNSFKQKAV